MATESTEGHGKIKPFLQKSNFFFAIQRFSKQSLYRALSHPYKIIFIFPCSSVDSVAIKLFYLLLLTSHFSLLTSHFLLNYASLSRNHRYVLLIPSSREIPARQPRALILEVSTSLRGVPSGLLAS